MKDFAFFLQVDFFLGPSGSQAMHCTWSYSYEGVLKGNNDMQLLGLIRILVRKNGLKIVEKEEKASICSC